MTGRPHQPNDPGVMASVEAAMTDAVRGGPLTTCWNWRHELAIPAALAGGGVAVGLELGTIWLVAIATAGLAGLAALLCWPPSRSRLIARAWSLITPHRIRVGCKHAWVQTRSGRLPIVLRTIPADFGERVVLWCLAGITVRDLYAARDILAAACWASEVRVRPSPRRAHIVTLEVIRHQITERAPVAPAGWPDLQDGADGADPEEPVASSWEGNQLAVPLNK
jgi:hypothetical protein